MLNTTDESPVILDFSDVPPAKRQKIIDYLTFNHVSLRRIKTDDGQSSFRFVWEKLIPAHESIILQRAYPKLKEMGVVIEHLNKEPFNYHHYQTPAFYQTPVGAVELDFINIPATLRKNVVRQFRKLGIELTPADACALNTEAKKLTSKTKYLVKPEHIETFFNSAHAKILLNKYKIATVYGQEPIPMLSNEIPQEVIEARLNRQIVLKAEQERRQQLQAAYCFDQTVHALEEAKKPFYLKPRQLLKAGVASLVISAAINPNGTSAFADNFLHGRFIPLFNSAANLVIDSAQNLYQPAQREAAYSYVRQNTSAFLEKPFQTSFNILREGVANIGITGFNIAGSLVSAGAYTVRPFVADDNTTFEVGRLTYENYAQNPELFVKNAFVKIDKKTGLKSNDTIFSIIEDGRTEAAKLFLQQNPLMSDLYHNNDFGITPFRYALMQNQPQIADIIFEDGRGFSNFPSTDGTTALMCAVEKAAELKGDEKQAAMIALAAKMIESPIVNIYTKDKSGKNVIDYIIENAVPELIEPIFKRGLLNKMNADENPLIFRVLDNPQMIEALVKTGQSLFSIDQAGTCALLAAFELNEANNYQNDAAITTCLNLLSATDIKSLRFDPVYAEHIEQWEKRNPNQANALFEKQSSSSEKAKKSLQSFMFQAKNADESSR